MIALALAALLAGTSETRPAPHSFAEAIGAFLVPGATLAVVARDGLGAGLIEVDGGEWRLADDSPPPAGRLARAAILRVEGVRIDGIRLEIDVVADGGGTVATFRFVLPFRDGERLAPADAVPARRYVERYLRLAADEAEARRLSERLAGAAPADQSSR